MNSVYFFLPFVLVAGTGIYQDVFAVQNNTVTGYDYFNIDNGDGTFTFQSHKPYLFDGSKYVPFIKSGNQIQTAQGSVLLNSDGSFSWTQNGMTDTIVAKYADISNLNSWTYPNTLNNDTPDISWDGSAFVSSKIKSGIGKLDYKYILIDGKWKTQLEATNLSGLTTKAFGFDQIIDLSVDTIQFGNQTVNLDNFNGTTYNKTWLANHQSKVINFLNGINFDFDLGFDDLYSVTVYDTGIGKSRLVFDYRTSSPLLPNETLVIDPTFGYASSTLYRVNTGAGAGVACPAASTISSTASEVQLPDSADGVNICQIHSFQWDITSIPDTANPTTITVKYDISGPNNPRNCDWNSIENKPSTSTAQNLFNDISDGTTFQNNNSDCTTSGTGKTLVLGTDANTDLKNNLSVDWWAVGLLYDNMVRDGSFHYQKPDNVELEVIYSLTPPPDAVITTAISNISSNAFNVTWSAPALNGGNLTNYLLNFTTPYGNPQTFLANTTNTFYYATGLTFGTDYSVRVSALTEIGYNATGNIANATTTSNEYATPPVLTMYANGTNTTSLNLQFPSSTMQNINGYRIQCEVPIGTGFTTITSNTTTSTQYYNYTGLTTNVIYNCRVYALNGSGISTASNEYDMTTFHLPDAVTTLSGTATGFATVMLSWTAPISYAPEIIGYMINYTTPEGNPTTIVTNSTGDDDTEATIDNLEIGGDFSFRVAPLTVHGTNASGNIFNVTTITNYNLGNLTNPDVTNENDFKIFFDRTDVDDTTILLDVTYPTAYVMNCEFSYKYSRDSQTYGPLTHTTVNSEEDKTTFQFNNVTNDIIDARCWDTATNDTGYYIITITDFELLNQIANLQNGTYGTEGKIGGIDIVTLIVIILGMIGFNRVTPIAGVIFTCVTIGITAYFGIIETYQIMFPIIALIVLLAYIRTRQD